MRACQALHKMRQIRVLWIQAIGSYLARGTMCNSVEAFFRRGTCERRSRSLGVASISVQELTTALAIRFDRRSRC